MVPWNPRLHERLLNIESRLALLQGANVVNNSSSSTSSATQQYTFGPCREHTELSPEKPNHIRTAAWWCFKSALLIVSYVLISGSLGDVKLRDVGQWAIQQGSGVRAWWNKPPTDGFSPLALELVAQLEEWDCWESSDPIMQYPPTIARGHLSVTQANGAVSRGTVPLNTMLSSQEQHYLLTAARGVGVKLWEQKKGQVAAELRRGNNRVGPTALAAEK